MKIEAIAPFRNMVGEGPHWDEKDKALLYVDILDKRFHRYFPETGRHQSMTLDGTEKGKTSPLIVPLENTRNRYIVGAGNHLALVDWPTITDPDLASREATTLCSAQNDSVRFNDGKCDPQGRLWTGTMGCEPLTGSHPEKKGQFFSLDSQGELKRWLDVVSISNGIAHSIDNRYMYYIDTMDFSVDVFDFDKSTGSISNRRVAFDFKKNGLIEEFPDGMTIDTSGNLWVACFNGHKIICIDPNTGNLIKVVDLPSKNITSVCFGGADYSTLYVTTAAIRTSDGEILKYYESGKTLAITGLGAKGFATSGFKYSK